MFSYKICLVIKCKRKKCLTLILSRWERRAVGALKRKNKKGKEKAEKCRPTGKNREDIYRR